MVFLEQSGKQAGTNLTRIDHKWDSKQEGLTSGWKRGSLRGIPGRILWGHTSCGFAWPHHQHSNREMARVSLCGD